MTKRKNPEDKLSAGRPSSYTPELVSTICTRLAEGRSLRSICQDENMPALSTVMLWVVNGKHPEFSEHYAQAREANGHAHGDRVVDLVDKVLTEEINPQAAKVAIDALKWSAERMAPKQYGSRTTTALTGPDGGPVEVVDNDLARRLAFALINGQR